MAGPLSLEQATQLRDNGYLEPGTFTRMFPDPTSPAAPMAPAATAAPAAAPMAPAPPAAASPVPEAPAATVPVPAAPEVDPEEARKARQRELFAGHKEGVARMELDSADRRAADAQADLVARRDLAIRMGVAPAEADKQLKPVMERAAMLTADATRVRSGVETADLKAGEGAPKPENVVLATDTAAGGISPQSAGQSTKQLVDGMLQGATAGIALQEQGVRVAAEAGKSKAAEEAAYLERLRQEDDDRIKTIEVNELGRKKRLDDAFTKVQSASDELARQAVDPGRIWANRTTGEKVMAGIGMFLGAFGAAANKGVNPSVSIIQDAIDRDIKAQQANIQTKKDVYTARQGLYSDMLATFKDRRVAEEAARAAYLDNAQLTVKGIAAKYAGGEIEGKALTLIGELEQKKIAARQAMAAALAASFPVGPEANPEALKPDQRERFVPGYGLALTKEDATKLKGDLGEATATKGTISRLLTIAATPGKSSDMGLRTEAQTLAGVLKGQLRTNVVGPGAVTDKEQELLDTIVADPTRLFSLDENNKRALETLLSHVDRQTASKVQASGLRTPESRIGFKTAVK